ncbi:hypothetical protein HNV12_01515 [Methanococcoides sp. SA1]|nr:hypothetical protein [Methanococcoides sp. SA1]
MGLKDIRKHILENLFFPKKVVIDRPGVIINQIARRYSKIRVRHRIIFFFEDIVARVQLKTLEEIGAEKTNELWYKIGKDFGVRYLLLANAKRPPVFLTDDVLNYMLAGFRSGGFSVAENIFHDEKNKSLILEGGNNLFCRKSGIGACSSGLISAIFSFLHGENIEGLMTDCSPDYSKIVLNPKWNSTYVPNISDIEPAKDYEKKNFSIASGSSKLASFREFVNFKKIKIDSFGKFNLMGKSVVPMECGFLGLMMRHYDDIGLGDFLRKLIIDFSREIAKDILNDIETYADKIKFVKNMFSALGWGILHIRKKEKCIFVDLLCPPVTRFNFTGSDLVLNGFLDVIFDKKVGIVDTKHHKCGSSSSCYKLKIHYRIQ